MKRIALLVFVVFAATGVALADEAQGWWDYLAQGDQKYDAGDFAAAADLYEKGVAAAGDNVDAQVRLLDSLSQALRISGRHDGAQRAAEAGLVLAEEAFGPDAGWVASLLVTLGDSHASAGDDEEAIPLFERALPIIEREIGAGSMWAAAVLDRLAVAYRNTGALATAADRSERVLHLNDESAAPSMVARQTGFLVATGRWDDAREMAITLHRWSGRHRSDYDLWRAEADTTLATVLRDIGELELAREALQRADSLAGQGPLDLSLRFALVQASVLDALGMRDQAGRALDPLVPLAKTSATYADVIAVVRARLAITRGRSLNALRLVESQLDAAVATNAADQLTQAQLMLEEARVNVSLRRFAAAAALVSQVRATLPEGLHSIHGPVILSIEVRSALGTGDITTAKKAFRALTGLAQHYPVGHRIRGDTAVIGAIISLHESRDDEAERRLASAKTAYMSFKGPPDLVLAAAAVFFAEELVALNRGYERADQLLRDAMATLEARFGAEASELIRPLSLLVVLIRRQGRQSEADALASRVSALRMRYSE